MQTVKSNRFRTLWRLCPVRHTIIIISLAIIALYFLLRSNLPLMSAVSNGFVQPYHRLMGRITSIFPFSLAELIYVLAILFAIKYVIKSAVEISRGNKTQLYRLVATVLACALGIYAGISLFWGVYYHSFDFTAESGISGREMTVAELRSVTAQFADYLSELSPQVARDESGLYVTDIDELFEKSTTIYRNCEQEYPFLAGSEIRPKKMVFSLFMSYINFTGFFFPFTGEANLNINAPVSLLPATIAHEIAHQRGIAPEDEANFVATLACLSSDDPEYKYSGALLAYIHLSNALYAVDYNAWYDIAIALPEAVKTDLDYDREYWQQFETAAAEVSDAVYTGFLQSHGQVLGTRSYGACVDLLVAHYYNGDDSN